MRSPKALRNERYRHGALNIETTEVRPLVLNQQVVGVVKQEKNRATELIEDFMIAANGVVARLLQGRQVSSIRRVVKTPDLLFVVTWLPMTLPLAKLSSLPWHRRLFKRAVLHM